MYSLVRALAPSIVAQETHLSIQRCCHAVRWTISMTFIRQI